MPGDVQQLAGADIKLGAEYVLGPVAVTPAVASVWSNIIEAEGLGLAYEHVVPGGTAFPGLGGSPQMRVPLVFSPALAFTAVTPNTGLTTGGTTVTITGTGFSYDTAVTFGGSAATSVVVSGSTSVTCVTPAHAAGAVNIVVTKPSIPESVTAVGAFTYTAASASTFPALFIAP
jgi:hypothetical protein